MDGDRVRDSGAPAESLASTDLGPAVSDTLRRLTAKGTQERQGMLRGIHELMAGDVPEDIERRSESVVVIPWKLVQQLSLPPSAFSLPLRR